MGGRGREGAVYSPPWRAVNMTLTHTLVGAVLITSTVARRSPPQPRTTTTHRLAGAARCQAARLALRTPDAHHPAPRPRPP